MNIFRLCRGKLRVLVGEIKTKPLGNSYDKEGLTCLGLSRKTIRKLHYQQ
jgi:hypothetical protein